MMRPVGGVESYPRELRELQRRGIRVAGVLVIFTMPLVYAGDVLLYPSLKGYFLGARVLMLLMGVALVVLARRDAMHPFIGFAALVGVAIAVMVIAGFLVVKPVGPLVFTLVVAGLNAILPMSLLQAIALSVAAWAAYAIPIEVAGGGGREFLEGNLYLGLTVLACVVGGAAADRARRAAFDAHAELTRRAEELHLALAGVESAQRAVLHQERLAAVGRLATSIIHHVANPMAYVSANLELLAADLRRAGSPRPDAEAMVAELRDGVGRVSAVLDALRPYARAARAQTLDDVDLKDALDSAVVLVERELEGRKLERDYGALPLLRGRPEQLAEALHALLDSAVAAAPRAGRVSVRAAAVHRTVTIEITRDGPPITPEECARLFEPFAAEAAQAGRRDLRLWIARAIAREHGGDIAAEPAGGGVRFRFSLPLPAHGA
jgi:signal transduction histidine kinase